MNNPYDKYKGFTPGPYKFDIEESEITIIAPWSDKVRAGTAQGVGDYRGIHMCELQHQGKDAPVVSLEQAIRNAKILVAAPEFLEDCRDMWKQLKELSESLGKLNQLSQDVMKLAVDEVLATIETRHKQGK